MLISHLWGKPSDLSEFVQFITNQFFFSDLAWSKSQYVYYRPTCIHTHFKNFGPCKTLPFSKYTTKGTLMANGVGYHNHICIKLKTGQFNKQFIHVGNWAKKSSIIQPSALCSFFTWLLPGEKITFNLANSNYSCWGHFLNQLWVEKLLTTLPYDEWWITLSWVSIAILLMNWKANWQSSNFSHG